MSNCIIWKNNLAALRAVELNFDEFTSGGLHEKHAVGTWEPSQRLLENRGKPRKPVSRWPVAGPSGCILTSSQKYGKINIYVYIRRQCSYLTGNTLRLRYKDQPVNAV
jgi:hypothetical protein